MTRTKFDVTILFIGYILSLLFLGWILGQAEVVSQSLQGAVTALKVWSDYSSVTERVRLGSSIATGFED